MAVDLRQTHFRFGKDDGTEAAHTFWQNEDVDHTQFITADWTFLLRFTEQEAGGTAAANTDAQFQYNKNGAGWVDITTISSVVKAVAVNAFTNAQACTKRLSGTGTFETSGAGCTEDGSSGGTANDIAASGNSETEAGLQVVFANVANNDTIQFRFTSPDWTVTYSITPTLTINRGEIEYGTLTLSGTGLLGAGGVRTRQATSTLAGLGNVAVLGGRTTTGATTLAGTGVAFILGSRELKGVVGLLGSGSLAALGGKQLTGVIALYGGGLLAGTAQKILTGAGSFLGAGSLAVIGQEIASGVFGSVSLSGAGYLQAVAEGHYSARVLLSSGSSLSVLGAKGAKASAHLVGGGLLKALAGKLKLGSFIFSGLGSIIFKAAFPDVMCLLASEGKVYNLILLESESNALTLGASGFLVLTAVVTEKKYGVV